MLKNWIKELTNLNYSIILKSNEIEQWNLEKNIYALEVFIMLAL